MSVKIQPSQASSNQQILKQFAQKELQFKKEKALLIQQIQLLEQELSQYKQREVNNKKINQSIMITYQQNQNLRQESSMKTIKTMNERHQKQISKIKEAWQRQRKALQSSLAEYKSKYEQALIEGDKKFIQFQKKLLQMKRKYDSQHMKQLEEKRIQYESKIQYLTEKLKQAESMAEVYNQFVQKRRAGYTEEDEQLYVLRQQRNSLGLKQINLQTNNPIKDKKCYKNQSQFCILQNRNEAEKKYRNQNEIHSSRKSRLKSIEQNNVRDLQRLSASRQSVKLLTYKIEKAVSHLKGSNNFELHERINQKLAKRLG